MLDINEQVKAIKQELALQVQGKQRKLNAACFELSKLPGLINHDQWELYQRAYDKVQRELDPIGFDAESVNNAVKSVVERFRK